MAFGNLLRILSWNSAVIPSSICRSTGKRSWHITNFNGFLS
jgi:hypothetical protein